MNAKDEVVHKMKEENDGYKLELQEKLHALNRELADEELAVKDEF